MNQEPLLQIFKRLSVYINKHKVLSEGELKLKIQDCLHALSTAERARLERDLGGTVEAQIFTSITSTEKVSVFSPDLRTKINYQGEVFYCLPVHGYLAVELESAFLRWTKLRSPLSTLRDVLQEFLERCGYVIRSEPAAAETSTLAVYAEKSEGARQYRLRLSIFSSIKFVPPFMDMHPGLPEGEAAAEMVMVVPTEKTPAPFISFVREHDVRNAQIWILEVANRTINPFIGMPADPELEKNFANPEQARKAVSIWMRKMVVVE
ncbi:MAG TPA: hypothetical protein ENN68_08560 [Methanomicrobia archaeon]|nr:hypothetical protein [Methanomicrobia archaeon]